MESKLKPPASILNIPNRKFFDADTNMLVMRHATSDMNEALSADNKQKDSFDYFGTALNPEMKDATLSEKGKQEAKD